MLEQIAYQSQRISKQRQKVYQVGDLENLSASVLYSGDSGGPKFGSSNFQVSLPESNSIDKGLKISTPSSLMIVNSYQRIIGQSGVDYFNLDGSLAGRILGLNNSEVKYLKESG